MISGQIEEGVYNRISRFSFSFMSASKLYYNIMISIKLRILLRIIQCCQYTFISSFLSANLHNILYVPGFKFIFPTPFTVIYCAVFPLTLEYNSQFIDTYKAKVSKEVLKCSKLLPFTTLEFISVQTMLCLIIFYTSIPPSVLIFNIIYLFLF